MADDIIQFAPGGKVTAEETNENNLLLKEWALDNSQSEAYIDGKIATLTTNLNSQISSLNSQIATKAPLSNPTLTGTVKVPNNAAVGTAIATAAISKSASGYLKLGNGIIIQWGRQNSDGHSYNKKYSLPTAFSSTNYKVVANLYNTNDSDRVFFVIKTQATSYFYARAQGVEGGSSGTTACQWIAIGY
jgi:hypothetical protein